MNPRIGLVLAVSLLCLFTRGHAQAQLNPDNGPRPTPRPVPLWGQPLPNSFLAEEREGIWLVEAQSTGVDNTKFHFPQSVVTIVHPYTGPASLVGQTFVPEEPFHTGQQLFPLFPLGPKGLFAIHWIRSRADLERCDGYGRVFPRFDKEIKDSWYRGSTSSSYEEAREQALAVEQVARASRDQQIKLLMSYARSSRPLQSAWAISDLGRSDLANAPQFLLGLANKKQLPVEGQLATDETLGLLDEQGKVQWKSTKSRRELLKRLVTSKANPVEAKRIVNWIVFIARDQRWQKLQGERQNQLYHPPIPFTLLAEFLRTASNNPQWPQSERRFVLTSLEEVDLASK